MSDNETWQYLPIGRNCFSIVNPDCEVIFDVSALENSTAASDLEDSMKRLTRAVNGEAALKKRVVELETAIEAMRVSGGSAEFQLAYDRALELLKGGAQ